MRGVLYFSLGGASRGRSRSRTRRYNEGMPQIPNTQQKAIDVLARDLDEVFGPRLQSLVAYPGHQADGSVHSCAIVDGLGFRDLGWPFPLPTHGPQPDISAPRLLAS